MIDAATTGTITAAVVRPGDTLVIAIPSNGRDPAALIEQAHHIKADLPEGASLVVLLDGEIVHPDSDKDQTA